MAIIINDGWDVSHHHSHEAFIHLGEALAFNKHATKKYEGYEEKLHWAECLGASADVRMSSVNENKLSIKAVVLFQASMEAWISWAYTNPTLSGVSLPRHFVPKWEAAFSHFGNSHDFSTYAEFYREIRNPIVHPSQQSDVEKVAKVWCKPVYEGLKAGWSAMEALSSDLGQPFDNDSWKTMCSINGVPEVIDGSEITDLKELEIEMRKRHLDGANRAQNAEK